MVCTRSYIAHVVGIVSKFMRYYDREHWRAVKWIYHYLVGTSGHALWYISDDVKLQGYVDGDMADDTGRSTTMYIYTLQKIFTLSTTEAENVVAIEA